MKERDQEDLIILRKYHEKSKHRDGIKQLEMAIPRGEGVTMNHKKIGRLKAKYNLVTIIRVKRRHQFFAKKKQEHESCPNLLERNFRDLKADQVYSTDITTLKYNGKKAYFAAVKDLGTREIVGTSVSSRIDINLTDTAMRNALKNLAPIQKNSLMVHSDQGFHFTHFSFRKLLEDNGVMQSMSRKGNCLDNAPIESFFGLIKDHIELKGCEDIEDVQKEVTRAVRYYNCERPQRGLKKMPPTEYRRHFY
jgi:putative transposase